MLFSKPEATPITVGDRTLNFYPISVRALTRLRDLAKPIGQALTTLLGSSDRDFATKVEEKQNADKSMQRTTDIGAISPDLAKQRLAARQEAVSTLVDAVLNPTSAKLLAELLIDSLRDDFERKKGGPIPTDIDTFLESMTVDVLPDMLQGLAEANKKLFAPLKDRAASVGAALKARLAPEQRSEPLEE
jgi:hypothetical protein